MTAADKPELSDLTWAETEHAKLSPFQRAVGVARMLHNNAQVARGKPGVKAWGGSFVEREYQALLAEARGAQLDARVEELDAQRIGELIAEGDGFWRGCSGCHELNEGQNTGPYSAALRCHLGNGCSECGGIGAIWDDTDYDAMARSILADESRDRDYGGRLVREAWVRWALTQPDPKPTWLVAYDELSEADKEADRQIADALWSVTAPALTTPPATAPSAGEAEALRLFFVEVGPGNDTDAMSQFIVACSPDEALSLWKSCNPPNEEASWVWEVRPADLTTGGPRVLSWHGDLKPEALAGKRRA